MRFFEGMEVCYQSKCGIIDFVSEYYVVLKLPAANSSLNSARLLIFPEYYKKVEVLKDSGK